ncbi:threonine aldolase family protein [Gluconacetobacter diazotrophicus]|uniref:L-threonine aldolase n=1 Tax=Gluconacetobacter diazotrophicus (strain ATCC 49037 / DSM 5601 / CCUG 37298 / CIP 103539 / LMG 7603 / PAl5) TaxID=272568 RepID=A9HEK9_GLUDA|nr:beta-eliminating lyase-related protein [Gluconacetobacter diazotrophicus]CAP55247.1 putative threonine aldolase [Gluconacetobacter diazotrophicus PA1 5]
MVEQIRKNFSSDNVVPACPAVMSALMAANEGAAPAYGADAWTARLQQVAADVFQHAVQVFPVTTGTAANALALAAITPPYGAVLCDESAHIVQSECGAPDFYTGGARLLTIPSEDGRMDPAALSYVLDRHPASNVQDNLPTTLSLTQATEWGTVYDPARIADLTARARARGLAVHLDGARLANAIVHLGCTPAEATWKAGIDVLALGATKNGAMAAEAVIIFDPARAEQFARRRKRGGHGWSKQRFLSAQLLACLEDDLWLNNARQANAMAHRLAGGLFRHPGARLVYETQANEIFVMLPDRAIAHLRAAGFVFRDWPTPLGVEGTVVRLVTSYYTRVADVDAFLATWRK